MSDKTGPRSDNTKSSDGEFGEVSATLFESAPLMMTAEELSETLCISLRQVWRLKAKGDIPQPVNIGRSVRWPGIATSTLR